MNFKEYSDLAMRTATNVSGLYTTQLVQELVQAWPHVVKMAEDSKTANIYYKELIKRFEEASARDDLAFGLLLDAAGLAGEAGEVSDYLKKVFGHQHELDKSKLKKELGDILWYVNRMARRNGWELEDVASENIEKLQKRYPEGFSTERSINRPE